MLTTIQTLALAKAGIDQVINTVPEDMDTQWEPLFNIVKTREEYHRSKSVTGFGMPSVVPEGTNLDYDRRYPLYTKDIYPEMHAIGFKHTVQAEYTDVYGQIMRDATEARNSMYEGKEQSMAQVIVNGFDSTSYAGPDTVSLFHTAHPTNGVGSTYANRPSTDYSLSAVNFGALRTILRKQKDPRNKQRRFRGKVILVVPNDLEYNAKVIMGTERVPGAANWDKNVYRDEATMLVMDYLTDANDWFIFAADKTKHTLKAVYRIPITSAMEPAKTENLSTKFAVYEEWATGWDLGYGLAGTQN